MDNLQGNKIFAAILVGLLVALVTTIFSEMLVAPKKIEKDFHVVDVPEGDASQSTATTTEDVIESLGDLLKTADIAKGQEVAKKCVQCHTFEKGGPNKVGPDLWNIVGAKPATKEGYAYSEAMKKKDGAWTYEELNHYLYNPRKLIPGTKMSFAGLKNVQDRANLIAYLRTLSDSPKPL